jgi:RNA polymerase sigma-70 factor (ECF subfamily)
MGQASRRTMWSTLIGTTRRAADENEALRQLYDEQADHLYRYVLRMLGGDRYEAEDIVQETMLRCWRHQDLSRSAEDMRPWLFRVARNLVIDNRRARNVRPHEVDGSVWLPEIPAETDGFEDLVASIVVGDAMRDLSELHRQALYQTYFLGRSCQEAAKALGVPAGTVKSRVHYALRELRAVLEHHGVVPAALMA